MKFKTIFAGFLCLLLILLLGVTPVFSEDKYIQVTGEKVNIRFKNNSNSTIIAKAKKGDIFELISEKGNWFEINIFSGEYRYIHKSLGKIVSYVPALPQSESNRKAIFHELLMIEDKADSEANRKYPGDIYKMIDYCRILDDRYKLEIFHCYNVQPPIYTKLIVEGVKKGWK